MGANIYIRPNFITHHKCSVMKVSVIGLGETAKDFKPDGSITIGVNDVLNCDYQVCIDRMNAFSEERLQRIFSLHPLKFFSSINDWSAHPTFKKIELKNIGAFNNRWGEFIPSSNNSPFVACGIAHKFFSAREVYLYGVDFYTHPVLAGDSFFKTAVNDFRQLQHITGMKIIPAAGSRLYGKL